MINYVYQLTSPRSISIKYENIDFTQNVIVKPLYMAICHADQRYYTGNRDKKILDKKLPMALIHECCGEVVFDNTGHFKIGDKVVLIPNVPGKFDSEIYENYGEGAKFLSSGYDGFMREYVDIPYNRLILFDDNEIPLEIASITEFISVCVHAVARFEKLSHSKKEKIGIWGDGSLAFVTANLLKKLYPESEVIVFGKSREKLSLFSFVDETILINNIPENIKIDHAFECAGGEGSYYAVDDIIKYIRPQGTVILMGVSENKIAINTRNILEKGLIFIGSSRSGYNDFKKTIEILKDKNIGENLKNLFWHKIAGLVVFNTDLILISKFISLEVVGIYASYQMIEQMILTILSIILNVLRPMIGKYIAIHTKEEIYNYWKKLNIFFLLISIIFSCCTYYLINGFVSLWLGKSYILSDITVLLICINLFVRCFRGITEIFKDGSGFFDDIHLPIAEATINFVSSLILVFYLGLNGVILGTILSNILIISIAKPLLVFRRCFNKDYKEYIKIYGNYFLLIIFSLGISKFLLNYISIIEICTWIDWLKKAVLISSIVIIITLVIFIFNKDFRKGILYYKQGNK